MKKLAILAAVLVSMASTQNTFGQNYRKRETSLISMKLNVHEEYRSKLDAYSSLFRAPQNKNANSVDNQILYTAWDLIGEKLKNEVGMILLPLNAYGKKFTYDIYGFPDVGINRALSRGHSKFYLKIDMALAPEFTTRQVTKSQLDSANHAKPLQSDEIKPKLTIHLTIYSDKGIVPVATCMGDALTETVITLDKTYFDGIINSNVDPGRNTLYNLMEQAARKLITSVFSSR